MKAILFSKLEDANAALAACSSDVVQEEAVKVGEGLFAEQEPSKPYTWIVRHPVKAKWALIADEHVEAIVGKPAGQLADSWFPKPVLFDLY